MTRQTEVNLKDKSISQQLWLCRVRVEGNKLSHFLFWPQIVKLPVSTIFSKKKRLASDLELPFYPR